MTENERVRELRKARGMTLEQFGAHIGVQKAAVSKIERSDRAITAQMRRSICREFGVREEWLRDGEEPMEAYAETFDLDELADRRQATELERRLVRAYFELDAETRAAVMEKLSEVFRQADTPEQRARRRADDFYTEALAEEKAADERSASPPTKEKEA